MERVPLTTAPQVVVCRGCCCGSAGKHPGLDHAGQRQALSDAVADVGTVRVLDCLGYCGHSNVVVVRTGRAGSPPIWIGHLLGPERTEVLASWLRLGCPGSLPPALEHLVFSPKAALADPVASRDAGERAIDA